MKNVLKNRKLKRVGLFIVDLLFINLSAIFALMIGFNFEVSPEFLKYRELLLEYLPIYSVLVLGIFYLFGLYESLWKYASIKELVSIVGASVFGILLVYAAFSMSSIKIVTNFYVINGLLLMITTGGVRFSYRMVRIIKLYRMSRNTPYAHKKSTKIIIIGAGDSGVMIAKEIKNYPEMNKIIVGFLDDDESKIGNRISGIPVIGNIKSVETIVYTRQIDEIIIAIPSMTNSRRREVFETCKHLDVKLKTIPGLYDLIDGKVEIGHIRNVEIEDLLGREAVDLDNPEIERYIKDRVVIVTGGGGSIGSELCRQVAKLSPKMLVIFDIYENNAYEIQNELKRAYGDSLNMKVLIGSVRDRTRLEEVFSEYRPETVFHAAAHKHVPLMQDSPFEAIKNNSFGTMNTAEFAGIYGAKRFVFISTDKAVNPSNIMGASKRLAELGLQSINKKYKDTDFMAVRFGNVLGSNGSVIPLFKEQIENGGPVTVTHPDIIRYFMTIPEAVQLVLQAGSMATGGEVFVLDMGEPVKILELAKDLIRLSGFEVYSDISIEFVGLRPGEKLFEELLLSEEGVKNTIHNKIFVIRSNGNDTKQIDEVVEAVNKALKDQDLNQLEDKLKILIPKYKSITCKEKT